MAKSVDESKISLSFCRTVSDKAALTRRKVTKSNRANFLPA